MANILMMMKLNSNFVKFVHCDGYPISYLDIRYHSDNTSELRCLVERIQVSFEEDTPKAIVEAIKEGLAKMKEGILQSNTSEFSFKCGDMYFEVSAAILLPTIGNFK